MKPKVLVSSRANKHHENMYLINGTQSLERNVWFVDVESVETTRVVIGRSDGIYRTTLQHTYRVFAAFKITQLV